MRNKLPDSLKKEMSNNIMIPTKIMIMGNSNKQVEDETTVVEVNLPTYKLTNNNMRPFMLLFIKIGRKT